MKVMFITQNKDYQAVDDGRIFSFKSNKFLTPVIKNGYFQVRLSKNGKVKNVNVHRIVYEAFYGYVGKKQINHINGIRTDNRLINLEAVTHKQNNARRIFLRKGTQINTAKLTEEQVKEIYKQKKLGVRTSVLMKRFNVGKTTINRIASGTNWKHLNLVPLKNSKWNNPKFTGAMAKETLHRKYGKNYWKEIALGKSFKKHCKTCTCNKSI